MQAVLCGAHYFQHQGLFPKSYVKIQSHRCLLEHGFATPEQLADLAQWLQA